MCDLIDPDTKQWKRDPVFSCFDQAEAQQIISIPISHRLPEDKLIWHWEKDGEYSVRLAYHILYDERYKNLPGPSHIIYSNLWKEIWHASVPNRIRNFLWRLAKNSLPTRFNLSRKGVQVDLLCPLCFQAVERQEHLFMQCPLAALVWFSSPLGIHVPSCVDLNEWMMSWLTCEDKLATQLLCTTL